MSAKKVLSVLWDYIVLSFGTLLYCLAWDAFMIPNAITSGGLTGACTILQFATGGAIPVSYSYIVANSVLILIGSLILGKGFGFRTIYVIILSTILFQILPTLDFIAAVPGKPLYIGERILIPIIGGSLEAIGISFIFNRGGSTGGTDIVALIVNKFWPVSMGRVFLYADLFIIASILLVPGKSVQDMIYGYIAMITFSVLLDALLLGRKSSIQVLIFSKENARIADYIIGKMDRGVTAIKSVGWFTKQERDVLLVLIRKTQIQELTRAVKEIDKDAFMSVSPASSVFGEGFEEMKTGITRRSRKRQVTKEIDKNDD